MKLKVWMAESKKGKFLCRGNQNSNLSYHLCFPFTCEYLCHQDWLMCRTKQEILAHLPKWHHELRSYARTSTDRLAKNSFKQARCHPVKMVVSWEPETKGETK